MERCFVILINLRINIPNKYHSNWVWVVQMKEDECQSWRGRVSAASRSRAFEWVVCCSAVRCCCASKLRSNVFTVPFQSGLIHFLSKSCLFSRTSTSSYESTFHFSRIDSPFASCSFLFIDFYPYLSISGVRYILQYHVVKPYIFVIDVTLIKILLNYLEFNFLKSPIESNLVFKYISVKTLLQVFNKKVVSVYLDPLLPIITYVC